MTEEPQIPNAQLLNKIQTTLHDSNLGASPGDQRSRVAEGHHRGRQALARGVQGPAQQRHAGKAQTDGQRAGQDQDALPHPSRGEGPALRSRGET